MAWRDVAVAAAAVYAALVLLSFMVTRLRAPGFRVKGKHVFVTGGSEGLGLAVSIITRRIDKLEEAKAEIEAVYKRHSIASRVFTQSCDVVDFDAVQRAIDAANAFHERVTDHVVYSAGYIHPGYFLEQSVQLMERMMDVNYFGTLHAIRAALPAMTREPPSDDRQFVLIGSGLSLIGCIGTAQYSTSKFAFRGMAEALRNELRLYGIRVSIFYAGNIDTVSFRKEEELMPPEGKTIEGVSTPLTADKAAQQMVDGVARGDFSITNDPLIFLLRVLANGVTPRWNSPLELVLLPLAVPIGTAFLAFMDAVVWWSRRRRARTAKEASNGCDVRAHTSQALH